MALPRDPPGKHHEAPAPPSSGGGWGAWPCGGGFHFFLRRFFRALFTQGLMGSAQISMPVEVTILQGESKESKSDFHSLFKRVKTQTESCSLPIPALHAAPSRAQARSCLPQPMPPTRLRPPTTATSRKHQTPSFPPDTPHHGSGPAHSYPSPAPAPEVQGQAPGHSHDGGQGAVTGGLIETLRVSGGLLRVLEAAFGGGEVGCKGREGGDVSTRGGVVQRMAWMDGGTAGHWGPQGSSVPPTAPMSGTGKHGRRVGQQRGACSAAAAQGHSEAGALSQGARFWGAPRQGHNLPGALGDPKRCMCSPIPSCWLIQAARGPKVPSEHHAPPVSPCAPGHATLPPFLAQPPWQGPPAPSCSSSPWPHLRRGAGRG